MSKKIMSGAPGWYITKKAGYALATIAVATVVIVGLLVYYVGVMGVDCEDGDTTASTSQQDDITDVDKPKVTDVRLPVHVKPLKYRLMLVPFIVPGNFTIRGDMSLKLTATMSGPKNFTLHTADIDINNDTVKIAEVTKEGRHIRDISIVRHSYDKDREFYIAHTDESVQKGKFYTITMSFVAELNDNLKGFYRSVYVDKENNKTEYIATTQFQPTDARRAFPCFDEPGIKAKFEVSLGRRKDMTSISNMPIKQGQKGMAMEGSVEYVWDHFEESVAMPTYLVAFIVSKFGHEVAPKRENNVQFGIWARKGALDQIAYAKDIGPAILEYFENYFDIKYPLPKMDMIAIPDFAAGAMENWGLVTYRETALLFKPGVSSVYNKQRIAIVISHELAHQWFGDLVTPSWWTDLWLNEGFASYVEYLGVEAVAPELKLLEQFVVTDLQNVFRIDSLATSHPISIPVKHPDEINEIFDKISYSKGASIIRMMNTFLTENTFRRGLTNYLNVFSYGAAEQDDLWKYLTQQAHIDQTLPLDVTVKTIMDTWTLQMGFPVVTVKRNYDDGTANLHQQRFLISEKGADNDDHVYRWWIPITFTTVPGDFNNTYSSIWMSDKDESKTIRGMPSENIPVIFNLQETGYYRVNYDKRNWELLIAKLKSDHRSIHVINRAQLIDDAFNLARVGMLDYNLAMDVTTYLKDEDEYIPWAAALTNLKYLNNMLKRSNAYGDFKRYIRRMVDPLFNRLGFEEKPNDEHLDIFLRAAAVKWACSFGNPKCLENVKSQYRDWMDKLDPDTDNPINVNMKGIVYCHALSQSDEKEWNFGWERYKKSNVASEKSSLLTSLACTKEIWLLNRYLNMSLTKGSGVRKQDGRIVISMIADNIVGRDLAFDYVRDKWDVVVDYYGSASFALSGLMKSVLKDRNTPFGLEEIAQFEKKHRDTLSSAKREVRQAIEGAEANIDWMNKNYQVISDFLTRQN